MSTQTNVIKELVNREFEQQMLAKIMAARVDGAGDTENVEVLEGELEEEDVVNEKGEVMKLWYYTQPLETKEQEELLVSIRKMVNDINAEFSAKSVFRVHADQANELSGQKIRDELAAQEVKVTMTPGYEPANNGRAERAIGLVKGRARAMLMIFESTEDQNELWGCAVMHASALQRRARQGRPHAQHGL